MMAVTHWITRDLFARQIKVCSSEFWGEELNFFLQLARESDLQEILESVREDPRQERIFHPGEYLTLRLNGGRVEAEANFFGDRTVARLEAEVFAAVLEDFLRELDKMYRELGLRE